MKEWSEGPAGDGMSQIRQRASADSQTHKKM